MDVQISQYSYYTRDIQKCMFGLGVHRTLIFINNQIFSNEIHVMMNITISTLSRMAILHFDTACVINIGFIYCLHSAEDDTSYRIHPADWTGKCKHHYVYRGLVE